VGCIDEESATVDRKTRSEIPDLGLVQTQVTTVICLPLVAKALCRVTRLDTALNDVDIRVVRFG